MISFDLSCHYHHVFEVWFRSSADYAEQLDRQLVSCPVCGDKDIKKAAMSPNISAKHNSAKSPSPGSPPASPPDVAEPGSAQPFVPDVATMLAKIAEAQAERLAQSRWVGHRFAEEARAAHRSSERTSAPAPAIHGQATQQEAEDLAQDGIAVMPLLVPFTPPELLN